MQQPFRQVFDRLPCFEISPQLYIYGALTFHASNQIKSTHTITKNLGDNLRMSLPLALQLEQYLCMHIKLSPITTWLHQFTLINGSFDMSKLVKFSEVEYLPNFFLLYPFLFKRLRLRYVCILF